MTSLTPKELEDAHQHHLYIDKERFTLTHYFRPRKYIEFDAIRTYDIALGAKGYATPGGVYLLHVKVKCPDWLVPNSDWTIEAGLKPGTVVKGCTSDNPLKARWLGVTPSSEGVGIHGTSAEWSLGTRASHGCIRMDPDDVKELYDAVPLGATIQIKR